MGRTKAFLHNVATAALLQIVTMVAGFVLPRVMLRMYGSEINGLVSSLTQFLSCFNLVEAGISASVTYALYAPIAQRDEKRINGILVAARDFYRKAGYIFLSLALGLAVLYPFFINVIAISAGEIRVLVLVLGTSSVLEFFVLAKYRVFLTADQKMYIISLASVAATICNVVFFSGMAVAGFSVVYAKFVALISVFVKVGIIWQYCHNKYRFLVSDEVPVEGALSRRWDAFYLQILGMIQDGAPVILATFLTDLKTVSIFSIYSLVNHGLRGLIKISSSGLSASFGDIIARKETGTLQRAFGEFEFLYCLLCAGMYGTAFVLIIPFIMLYTRGITDANYNQPYWGALLLLEGLLYVIKNPNGMLVISAGLYKETRWQTTTQGAIELFGGLLLGSLWGLEGIIYGMILSNLYRDIDLPVFISRHVTGVSPWKSFQRYGYSFLIVGLLSLIPFFVTIKPQDYGEWLVNLFEVIVCAIIITGGVGSSFELNTCKGLINRIRFMRRQ